MLSFTNLFNIHVWLFNSSGVVSSLIFSFIRTGNNTVNKSTINMSIKCNSKVSRLTNFQNIIVIEYITNFSPLSLISVISVSQTVRNLLFNKHITQIDFTSISYSNQEQSLLSDIYARS